MSPFFWPVFSARKPKPRIVLNGMEVGIIVRKTQKGRTALSVANLTADYEAQDRDFLFGFPY